MLKRVLASALLMVVGVVVAVAIVEFAVRFWSSSSDDNTLRALHVPLPGTQRLFGMQPGAETTLPVSGDVPYRVNAAGFRDRDYAIEKEDGTYRIVVLGDSVSFGYGVAQAETFAKRLESLPPVAEAVRLEVLNLGINGYNPFTERALLEEIGDRYRPDLVVVQFCINDLNPPTLHFDAQTRFALGDIPPEAFPDPTFRDAGVQTLLGPWCTRLRTCALARDTFRSTRRLEKDDALRAAMSPVLPDRQLEWNWLEQQYVAIQRVANRIGAEFALLAFPYESQVDDPLPSPVQEAFHAMADRHGWTLIDPLPRFRKAHEAGADLYLDLWHPNETGHALAAQEIAEVLTCRGILPLRIDADCLRVSDASGR